MKRFALVLSIIAALAVSAIANAQTTTTQSPMPQSNSAPSSGMQKANDNTVTGDWKVRITGPNFVVGNIHMTQVGTTVVGSGIAASGRGVLQFTGELQGNKISGKWRGPTGEEGWITLNFQNMSAFNGQWGYGGRNPSGSIVAQKVVSSDF